MPVISDATLPTASWAGISSSTRGALLAFFEKPKWPLFIYGPAGRGKSCVASVIYRAWPATPRENPVVWVSATAEIRRLTSAWFSGTTVVGIDEKGHAIYRGEEWIVRRARDAALMVFDDIGVKTPTDSQFEALLTLVDARAGKPTIYTSNLDPDVLVKIFDDRLVSRMCSGMTLKIAGPDRRTTG